MKRSGLCGLDGVELVEEGDSLFETVIELVLQWDASIEMREWEVDCGMYSVEGLLGMEGKRMEWMEWIECDWGYNSFNVFVMWIGRDGSRE